MDGEEGSEETSKTECLEEPIKNEYITTYSIDAVGRRLLFRRHAAAASVGRVAVGGKRVKAVGAREQRLRALVAREVVELELQDIQIDCVLEYLIELVRLPFLAADRACVLQSHNKSTNDFHHYFMYLSFFF